MATIPLDKKRVKKLKEGAEEIAEKIQQFVSRYSSVSVERTILRLYGVDGLSSNGMPLSNRLVEMWCSKDSGGTGISRPFTEVLLRSNKGVQETAELIDKGLFAFNTNINFSRKEIIKKEKELAANAISIIDKGKKEKEVKKTRYSIPSTPWRYLIVATGNIYEDRAQAESAIMSGADIIAVIRSTAQSLLDYVPFGATTEGVGGTYATQENFKIMRRALDEASKEHGRYIRLVNYSSGLCMAEIAACAAIEGLDILLNDSMYGILFRDINMKRTFIDQYFSRLICSRANIMINTGEDNYLTTADAIKNAHTVTASQLINEAMAKKALLPDELIGLGHVFEVDPEVKDAFLYELAHAQLARQLFPNSPLKYMPPTKHKSRDIFLSHCMDTMFNLASILTDQSIHLTGILTEANHTPHIQDRYESLCSVNYIFNIARSFGSEISFKKNGFIEKRADTVLKETEKLIKKIQRIGLMDAIHNGWFADISRSIDGGKGADGIFEKGEHYSNPIMELIEKKYP